MTIASAIDDVIIAQGGTPDPTDTIADSLVNLAGVLAGETIDKTETIEGAVRILGEHIGGGDMSSATVTYTLTGGKSDLYVEAAVAAEDESGKCSYPHFQSNETSGSFTVLLFGGKASAAFTEGFVTVVSGDAEADGSFVTIAGDCAVTVEPD